MTGFAPLREQSAKKREKVAKNRANKCQIIAIFLGRVIAHTKPTKRSLFRPRGAHSIRHRIAKPRIAVAIRLSSFCECDVSHHEGAREKTVSKVRTQTTSRPERTRASAFAFATLPAGQAHRQVFSPSPRLASLMVVAAPRARAAATRRSCMTRESEGASAARGSDAGGGGSRSPDPRPRASPNPSSTSTRDKIGSIAKGPFRKSPSSPRGARATNQVNAI